MITCVVLGGGTAGAYLGCKAFELRRRWKHSMKARLLVDGGEVEIFAEQLENGRLPEIGLGLDLIVESKSLGSETLSAHKSAMVDDDSGVSDVNKAAPEEKSNGVYKLGVELIDVNHHRRIKKGRLSKARKSALAGAKARFGTPARTAANYKAVHHFVYNSLSKSGVQEGQMCTVIPSVVSLVFIPNRYEIEADNMFRSPWAWWRRRQLSALPTC